MTFCERCGARYTRYDRYCPGCGMQLGEERERPTAPAPRQGPEEDVTRWLDDLEVLPADMIGPKRDPTNLPHAHLQPVRTGSGSRVQVVLDPEPDERFPEPRQRGPGDRPVGRAPEPAETGPASDTGWFMAPHETSGRRERPRDLHRPAPAPEPEGRQAPERPLDERDHYIHRAHGLEWQKEAQMSFDAEDGYHGPSSIRHGDTEDGAEWTVPRRRNGRRREG